MTRFAFVAAERGNHAVARLCRVVGASVSGFHAKGGRALEVEGSLTNPSTPGGRHGGEADPAAVHR